MVLLSSITSTFRPASRGRLVLAAVFSMPSNPRLGMSVGTATLKREAQLADGF
jgi:hypothetical protein